MDKQIIEKILDNAEVASGMDILDISAGELTAGCRERSPKSLAEGALSEAESLRGEYDRILLCGPLPEGVNVKRLLRRVTQRVSSPAGILPH